MKRLSSGLLVGLLWVAGIAGAQTSSEIYSAAARQFQQLYGAGQYEEALVQAHAALQAAPVREDPYIWVSKLSTKLGRDDEAIKLFGELAKRHPEITWPWYYKGFNEYHISRFGDAVESFRRATAVDPGHADSYYRLGMIRISQGAFVEARTTLEKAFSLDPNSEETAAELANVQKIGGDYEAAARTVEQALRVHPNSARLQMASGLLLARQGQLEKAEPPLRRAIELDPNMRDAHQELARLLLRSGKREEGRRHRVIAGRLKDYESYTRALDRLTAQVATSRDPGLPMLLGEVELTRGGYAEALQWFQRSQKLGQVSVRVAAGIAEAAFRGGNVGLGNRALQPLASSNSGRVDLARAAQAFSEGQHTAAVDHVRKAIKRGPWEREFLRRCASMLDACGEIEEADKLFAQAKKAPELTTGPDTRR